ncbi:DEAD/DEAH box helicase, partial [Desulfococcus sp.]|uniref:DEAD/DEAH box helicase n=1 Tax=Desulfococcus sp. TaxID=2025834 RepID=UPI0035937DCD
MTFQAFNLHPAVSAGVAAAGYTRPTPIQIQAIPRVMDGGDLMGLAQTGTGKTAAFALPILHRLINCDPNQNMQRGRKPAGRSDHHDRPRALILAPTRELAEQIHHAIEVFGRETRLSAITLYGGVNINPQIQRLRQGVDIVVACPGRLLDHLNRGTVAFPNLEVLVLDEADHMFDMGFLPDIRRILKRLPVKRQTLLFSATMPDEIRALAGEVLNRPATVQIGATAPADTVSHALYPVSQHLKTSLLMAILRGTDTGSVLVFTRTKHRARQLGDKLLQAGYSSASLQGNLSQGRRQAALDGFRTGKFQILVATDIAARGIDVSGVSHVINYDIPDTPDAYIHRIGRTGRAECTGDAFTLTTAEDALIVRAITKVLGAPIERRTVKDFDYAAPAPPKAAADSRRQGDSSARPA